jgi:hypothetical protein
MGDGAWCVAQEGVAGELSDAFLVNVGLVQQEIPFDFAQGRLFAAAQDDRDGVLAQRTATTGQIGVVKLLRMTMGGTGTPLTKVDIEHYEVETLLSSPCDVLWQILPW